MNVALFKKKLQIVGRVYTSHVTEVNFGKLYKEGFLSVVKLDVQHDASFPYKGWGDTVEQHEQKKLNFLKVNWEDDKDVRGFGKDNAWCTYAGCTDTYLSYSEEKGYTLSVTVYNGVDHYQHCRFLVEFKIEKFAPFNKVYGGQLSKAMYHEAKIVRQRQIDMEENNKIIAIEEQMLAEVIL